MNWNLDSLLDVLEAHGIHPYDDVEPISEMPEIGTVAEDEAIYITSLGEVFGGHAEAPEWEPWEVDGPDDAGRLHEWWSALRDIEENWEHGMAAGVPHAAAPPEPYCAWYCPIHYYGHSWGIYIRENCILDTALDIARSLDWLAVKRNGTPRREIARQLCRGAFYAFYLHEQFHHKVESLGFRLLVAAGSDKYRPYKDHVYRPTFGTANCLEESLANAESYVRLGEDRYRRRSTREFRKALRSYLSKSFPLQPPGYRQAIGYLNDSAFRAGQNELQSRVLDGHYPARTRASHWFAAPDMIRALMDITCDIYVILPRGTRPILRPRTIDPGVVISTQEARAALERKHGYSSTPGGKGSHIKLTKPGAPPIILPGNRSALSPGVLKDILEKLGGFPLSRAREVLAR